MTDTRRHAVFLVEKDIYVRQLISDFLTEAQFTITCMEDGYAALDRARNERPALVITDILIPELDGLALCRLIKRDDALRNTKVMVLSALSAEERALQSGADAFLKKPIEKVNFIAKIQSLIGEPKEKQA